MKTKRFLRARSDDAKQQRRDAVLAAARRLLQELDLSALTMDALAARAKLAKGTLYLYFPTKEAVFLELFVAECAAWAQELAAEIAGVRERDVAATVARSLAARPLFRHLLSVLHPTLERNADHDTLVLFKQRLLTLLAPLAAALEARMAWLPAGAALEFIVRLHALAVGFGQMTEPNALLDRVLERPELSALNVDFERELTATLGDLLRGMRARVEPRRKKG